MNMPITAPDAVPPSAPGTLERHRGARAGQPQLGRCDRQPRRREVQRPSLDDGGLHARPRQPDRSADRHDASRTPASPPDDLLLQGDCGGRGRQRRRRRRTRRARTRPPTRRRPRRRPGSPPAGRRARSRSPGAHPPTPAGSRATTSTARRRRASRPRPRTGSRSRRVRATTTPAVAAGDLLLQGDRRGQRRQLERRVERGDRDGPDRPPPGLVAAYGFDAGAARPQPTSPATATTGRSRMRRGRRGSGQVRKRAVVQRRRTPRHRPRLELARPDDRDDDRGVGQPDHGAGFRTVVAQGAPGRPRLRPVRELRHRTAPVAGRRSAPSASLDGAVAHRRSARGRTWPRRSTARRSVCSSTAPRSRQLASAGSILTSNSPVKIGGNSIWARVVQRPDRRGADLQPRPQRRRDPGRHERPRSARRTRRRRARPGTLTATGTVDERPAQLGRGDRQRRRRPLQRLPLDTAGFTPSTANRIAQPTGTTYTDTGRGRHLLLQGRRRGRRRQHRARRRTRRSRGRRRHDAALGARHADRNRCDRQSDARAGPLRPTTSASSATTSTARRRPASSPAPANRIAQPTSTSYIDNSSRPASTTTRSPPRTPPATSGPPTNEATRDRHDGHDRAERAGRARRRRSPGAPSTSSWRRRPTTSASSATTSTAARRPGSRRRRRTGSRSRPARATPTPASRRARTTTSVTAEDAAGNISAASHELTATIGDTTAPTRADRPHRERRRDIDPLNGRPQPTTSPSSATTSTAGRRRGFTPSAANRIAQPTGTTYSDSGARARHVLLQGDRRGRGRQRRPGLEHGERDDRRHDAAEHAGQPRRERRRRPGGADAGPPRPTTSASCATTSTARPSPGSCRRRRTGSRSRPARATPTVLAAGTYYYKVTAEDAAGNLSAPSTEAIATVDAPRPIGLVAAYGFDAGSGTTAADQSGNGNTATLANTTLGGRAAGRFGNALSFNGDERLRHRRRLGSLDLTNGMTIEALGEAGRRSRGFHTVDRQGAPGRLRLRRCTPAPTATGRSRRSTVGSDRGSRRHERDPRRHLDASRGHVRRDDAAALSSTARRSRQLASAGSIATSTSPSGSAATRSGASTSTA